MAEEILRDSESQGQWSERFQNSRYVGGRLPPFDSAKLKSVYVSLCGGKPLSIKQGVSVQRVSKAAPKVKEYRGQV